MTDVVNVWVIEVENQYEGWNGLSTDYTIDEEYGFFLTKEAVEAKCAQLLDAIRRPAYEKYVAQIKKNNEVAETRYTEALKDHEALVAGGRPSKEPTKVSPTEVRTFEEWAANWHYTRYNTVELKRGQL